MSSGPTRPALLAIDGGVPVRTRPMPPWPVYADDEIEAVGRVLRSGQANYWSGGEGRALEQELAGLVGVSHGLALANGSLALEAALLALEIGRGDEVVVTPRSFIASASAVVLRGARPVFADVDRDSGNLRADAIGAVLSNRTRAVLVVHLGGWPCDMDAILALAARCRLAVIEDCAQALGARYRGRAVGSFGSVAAYSFCQDKILSSGGEGGMLVSRDSVLWGRAWSARDHGANRAGLEAPDGRPGFRWYRSTFGSNWRMTEMQAAIARRQLVKLPDWLQTRRKNLALAIEGLADVPGLRVPRIPAQVEHAGYRYYLYVRPERLRPGWTRDRILCALAAEGVSGLSGTCPEIYRERAFADAGLGPASPLPVARELGETSLALLLHPGLSAGDMDDQIQALRKVMTVASVERTA